VGRWGSIPLGAAGDTILDDLGFDDGADGLEELAQVAGLGALGDLLHEDGALVAVVLGDLGGGRLLADGDAALLATSTSAVTGPVAVALAVFIVAATIAAGGARGASAGTTTSAVIVASVSTASSSASTAVAAVARVAAGTAPIALFFCVSTFARSRTTSISPPMVSVAASTPISIRLTGTVHAPITARAAVAITTRTALFVASLVAGLALQLLLALDLVRGLVEKRLDGVNGGHGDVGWSLGIDEWYRSACVCSHGEVQ
jgi:hypothetical protein